MRPCTSGRSTVIWRSKRPGRSSAESSTSGRLVAASTITPGVCVDGWVGGWEEGKGGERAWVGMWRPGAAGPGGGGGGAGAATRTATSLSPRRLHACQPTLTTAHPPPRTHKYPLTRVALKAIHLRQQLVDGLLALVIAAAHARAALAPHGVNLVDKDDAGGLGLSLEEGGGRGGGEARQQGWLTASEGGGAGCEAAAARVKAALACHHKHSLAHPPTHPLTFSNRSRTREAPTPTNSSTNSEAAQEKKGTPASPATALASRVLPVPGRAGGWAGGRVCAGAWER